MMPPSQTNPPAMGSDWLAAHMRHVIPAAAGARARTAAHAVSEALHLPVSGGPITTQRQDNSSQMSRLMRDLTLGQLKDLVAEFGASFSIEATTTETKVFKYSSRSESGRASR